MPPSDSDELNCEHGRLEGAFCPHCMGQDQMTPCVKCGCICVTWCVNCLATPAEVESLRARLAAFTGLLEEAYEFVENGDDNDTLGRRIKAALDGHIALAEKHERYCWKHTSLPSGADHLPCICGKGPKK